MLQEPQPRMALIATTITVATTLATAAWQRMLNWRFSKLYCASLNTETRTKLYQIILQNFMLVLVLANSAFCFRGSHRGQGELPRSF